MKARGAPRVPRGHEDFSFSADVKTPLADNIVIDKLRVGAYTARVDILAWNGDVPSWFGPAGTHRRSKFFPRGARGFIRAIGVYCRNLMSDEQTIYVSISPAPSLGPVYSGTIALPGHAEPAWRSWPLECMWPYDSLFIWAYTSHVLVQLAYDSGGPDCFHSTDGGATWVGHPRDRFWFRAEVQGMTAGDVPVSGTVNTIELPSMVTVRQDQSLVVPPLSEVYDGVQAGAGECLIIIFFVAGALSRDYLRPRVRCDGGHVMPFDWSLAGWNSGLISIGVPGISIGKWDTAVHWYSMLVVVPYPFKRTLEVGYYNGHPTDTAVGRVGYAYKKIG